MASLRNLAIAILRLTGHTSIAAALRYHARQPGRPLQTIMQCLELCPGPGGIAPTIRDRPAGSGTSRISWSTSRSAWWLDTAATGIYIPCPSGQTGSSTTLNFGQGGRCICSHRRRCGPP